MEYTRFYTKNGTSFVEIGVNLRIGRKHYLNAQHETLISLGCKQKVIIDVENLDGYIDGFDTIDGVEYWVEYRLIPTVEPLEEENNEP